MFERLESGGRSGEEALLQLAKAGETGADLVIGCTGGGSNFAGIVFPFLGAQLRGGKKLRIVAVEPAACPSRRESLAAT